MIGISHQLLLKQFRRRWRLVWTTCISRLIIIEFHKTEHVNVKDLSCCCEATPRKASLDWQSCWMLCICSCRLRFSAPINPWKPSNQSVMCLVRTGIGNMFEDFWWVTGFGQNPPRTTWYEVSTKCCLWKSNQQNQHLPCRKPRNTKLPFYLNLFWNFHQGLSLPVLMLHHHEMPWVPLPTTWCLKHAFHCTLCIWIFRNLAFCLERKRGAGRGRVPKITRSYSMGSLN